MKAPNSLCERSPEFQPETSETNPARQRGRAEVCSTGEFVHALAVAAKTFPMLPMFPPTIKHTAIRAY